MAGRQPNPNVGRQRDHDDRNALTIDDANAGGVDGGI
jgi:hypothetical protein